jgi:hypothetical protein
MKDSNGQDWEWCETCQCAFIRCSHCGNNCCNAGTGQLKDGTECGCKEAYAYYDEHEPPSKELMLKHGPIIKDGFQEALEEVRAQLAKEDELGQNL